MGHNEGKARDIRGTGGGTYEGHTNLDSYGTRMGHVRDTGTRKGHVRDTYGTYEGHSQARTLGAWRRVHEATGLSALRTRNRAILRDIGSSRTRQVRH